MTSTPMTSNDIQIGAGETLTEDGTPVVTINEGQMLTVEGAAETTGATETVAVNSTDPDTFVAVLDDGQVLAEDTAIRVNGFAEIDNSGLIEGGVNGVDFANTGTSSGSLFNSGAILSASRAVNLGGQNISLFNAGEILGTDDQRNGTIYSNSSAERLEIVNAREAVIDAGAGNQGAGIALQLGDVDGDLVQLTLENGGTIEGRGQGAFDTGLAGDGLRIFGGAENVTVRAEIDNNGVLTSDSEQGPTSALRISNGIDFVGTINNGPGGKIIGANNGLYFGDGDHAATVKNVGLISSDSRAVNVDGDGVTLINAGRILGTDDQRNGTIYADGPADDYLIHNTETGLIDAGEGNLGSAVSLQTGEVDGDGVTAQVINDGVIQGRGEATEGNGIGDGVRLFSGVEDATFDGSIVNTGEIRASATSEAAVAIRVESGVALDGQIENSGLLSATVTAIDASAAGAGVSVDNAGVIEGQVILSDFDDRFDGAGSQSAVQVSGGLGDDTLAGGASDDVLNGGSGSDVLSGGAGSDTVIFDGVTPEIVNLLRGEAVTEDGFSVSVAEAAVASLTTDQSPADIVAEAVAGNLYFNVHSVNVGSGEIRGQLSVTDDQTVDGVRTLTLSAELDSAQEPGGTSDSAATGQATFTVTVDGDAVSYSTDLSVDGLPAGDLLPVAGVSSIHIHNAPAGSNGPVLLDVVQDAGGDVSGATGEGSVFVPTIDTDVLDSIENVTVTGADDTRLRGNAEDNRLEAGGGDDVLRGGNGQDELIGGGGDDLLVGGGGADLLRGGGGNDTTDGGRGIDTVDYSDIGGAVTVDLGAGQATYGATTDIVRRVENVIGSDQDDTITGTRGDNVLEGGAGADTLNGGRGKDYLRGDDVGEGVALSVTVTNDSGTFLTPVWFGFHDGSFDLYDFGSPARLGLERLAEDGAISQLAAEFAADTGGLGADSAVFGFDGVGGPLDPGETATSVITLDPSAVGQGYFAWATMVIPSNDAFLASPGNNLTDAIFAEDGSFLGPLTIQRFGRDVRDAGTEVNTETDAAFLNQTAPNTGETENGVIANHIGFNGSEGNPDGGPVNILGGTSAPGVVIDPVEGDFTRNGGSEQLLEILVDLAEGFNDVLNGGLGSDTLEGGRGDDTLTGGRSVDTFLFNTRDGNDLVTDFESRDVIDVTAFEFGSAADALGLARAVDDTVVLTLDAETEVTFADTALTDLSVDNFLV